MSALIDMKGQVYGRLTVLSRIVNPLSGKTLWRCECECGNKTNVDGCNLRNGHTKSCGCLQKEVNIARSTTHGLSKSDSYGSWAAMMDRCHSPNHEAYVNYGGRGIKVCEQWHNFANFYRDMGNRPAGMSLDRVDNAGDYCPSNCRWATSKIQNSNRRDNRIIEFNGRIMTMSAWAREIGMNPGTLHARLTSGWPVDRALTVPKGGRA